MPHSVARFVCVLALIAAITDLPSARGADARVAKETPPSATPQPKVRVMSPQISVQIQQVQDQAREPAAGGPRREPYLGVVTGPVTDQLRSQLEIPAGMGLVVEAVAADSPAERAGMKRFDILRQFDDQIVCTAEQLSTLVKAAGKGKEVVLTVTRGGKETFLKVLIDDRDVVEGGAAPLDFDGLAELPAGIDALVAEVAAEAIPGFDDDVRAQIQQQVKDALSQAGVGKDGNNAIARVFQIYPGGQSQSVFVHTDERGTVEIRETNGKRTVMIKDPSGKQIYAGPLDTDADQEKVPEAFRGMVGEVGAGTATSKPVP